jgi:hypothetical protein
MSDDKLKLLSKPFPPNLISKLPKSTKSQTEALKANRALGIKCSECGGWHHRDVVHLDYVGHAALTHRLLETDLQWNWEPLATEDGLPKFDKTGGLWIKLTVCGVTRLGYGHAESSTFKEIGAREKEVIGDALRNAAMRFGAALELWHKGDLLGDDDDGAKPKEMKFEKTYQVVGELKTKQTELAHQPKNLDIEKLTGNHEPILPKQIEELRIAREKAGLKQEDILKMCRETFNKEGVKDLQKFELTLLTTMVKKKTKTEPKTT